MKSLYLKILYFIFYLCPTGISNKIESNEFDFQINLNFSFISIDTSYTLIVDRWQFFYAFIANFKARNCI